jgi:uncharacterized repeat protein (TIGR03803 family)
MSGTLYGTTQGGGTGCQGAGCGTIFALDPSTATETVIYSFDGYPLDGDSPDGLLRVKGTLYGTTGAGGASSDGTVFAFEPDTGVEKVLYSFCIQHNCVDGAEPSAAPIYVKGTLYGVTVLGGTFSSGVLYSVDPITRTEKVHYAFFRQQNCTDGAYPSGSPIDVHGSLYGATELGGAYGQGTVFVLKAKR